MGCGDVGVRAALDVRPGANACCAALAAAELVAAAWGRPGADLDAEARALATADLADPSVLEAALFAEGGRCDEGQDAVAELRARLGAAAE